jgi:hypothetical protein
MSLKERFPGLPRRTEEIIQNFRNLTTEEAIKLIEDCFDPTVESVVSNVIKGSTKLLANGGYSYVGLSDIDIVEAWAPRYKDNKGNEAQLSIDLRPVGQEVSIILTDNFLNLDLISPETGRKLKIPTSTLEYLLNSGIAINVKSHNPQFDCIYQTSVKILYNKPFGKKEYKRDDILYQEIKSMIG